MQIVRTWSYTRLDSEDVWDWGSGDFEDSDWPRPTERGAIVTTEDDGYRIRVRGVFHGVAPHDDVVPRRVAVSKDGLHLELTEAGEDAEFVVDVGGHVPYELVVEFTEQLDGSELPARISIQHYRDDAVVFESDGEI